MAHLDLVTLASWLGVPHMDKGIIEGGVDVSNASITQKDAGKCNGNCGCTQKDIETLQSSCSVITAVSTRS